MTKAKTRTFIALEFASGLGLGLLGGFLFSYVDKSDLYYSVMFTFITIFASSLTGIGLIGYLYLRQIEKKEDFGEAMILSFLGLILFLMLYALLTALTSNLIAHYLSSVVLPILLPVTGATIGFNYRRSKWNRQKMRN